MQMVNWMILLTYFIACHGQTIHLSITTTIGCYGTNVGGRRCSLFQPGAIDPVFSCLMKECVRNSNPWNGLFIRRCQYGLGDPNCVAIELEFEVPQWKQKDSGKCPESKMAFQLEQITIFFENDDFTIFPLMAEIYSSGKANSVPQMHWGGGLCPIAPIKNGLAVGVSQPCSLEGEIDNNMGTTYPLVQVESVQLTFLDEKTKNVIPMPAKQCASGAASSTAPPQKSQNKLIELLLMQLMLQNNGFVSRGAHPGYAHGFPSYAHGFPSSIAGSPSAFSGIPLRGLLSTTGIRRRL